MSKYFDTILQEICEEQNIELKKISNYSIHILKKRGIERYIWGKKFDVNSMVAARIVDNKSAMYSVLSSQNIPCIEHFKFSICFKNGAFVLDDECINKIHNALFYYDEIVIKPEDGQGGNDVYRCNDALKFVEILKKISRPYKYMSISPFYKIKSEYRTFFFNGKCQLTYKKERPYVIGNGESDILTLIKNKYGESNRIKIQGYSETYIPSVNEHIILTWQHNLANGSISKVITDSPLLEEIQKLTISAANAVQICFASVDIAELIDGELKVLEINSGVVMDKFIDDAPENYELAKNIYRDVIEYIYKTI